jgi:hypothetical protein
MLKSIKVDGVGPVRKLAASFGERLNVLTGDNGLGKSFVLDIAFWALSGFWPARRVAIPDESPRPVRPVILFGVAGGRQTAKVAGKATYDFRTQSWMRRPNKPIRPGLVLYASVDGGFVVWDPSRNPARDAAAGQPGISERPIPYQFDNKSLAEGLSDENGRPLCNGLISDWVSWYYERSGSSRTQPFAILESVVQQLAPPQEPVQCAEPRRVFVDDPRKFPTLDFPYGNVAFPHWSAGFRRVMNFAYLLVWAWYEHSQAAELRKEKPVDRLILLIDEVESHLHPKWQRMILPALLAVAQGLAPALHVQVLTATHSPLILASLEPHFDESKDRLFWFDLRAEEKRIAFQEYPWAIQGDVVGWLTSDIFGLQQARSKEAEAAIEAAEAFMRGDKQDLPHGLRTKGAIDAALRKCLPGMDPFWPRWVVEAGS